jgi:hypothetical protein
MFILLKKFAGLQIRRGESSGGLGGASIPYRWKRHRAPPKPLQQFVIMDQEEEKEKREEEEEKEEKERKEKKMSR